MDIKAIEQQLDRLYADLAELKRALITSSRAENVSDSFAWQDLFATTEEVSAQWIGPDAVDEIRMQREK